MILILLGSILGAIGGFKAQEIVPRTETFHIQNILTNGQLHIVTSQYNPAFVIDYRDIFPVSLSGLQFDATITDVEYITADVTFKHQQFFINDKNNHPL